METRSSAIKVNIDDVLKHLQEHVSNLENLLEAVKIDTDTKLKYQAAQITNLQTRISRLEDDSSYNKHLLDLNYRRLDDLEQYSRKVNLRLDGIPVFENDNPLRIMGFIKKEVGKLNLEIEDKEYDRCHRIGNKFTKNGKTCQSVILRMCSWRCRNDIFVNRKNLSFFVYADLTAERQRTFNCVKDELSEWSESESSRKVVNYVFVDDNCKMKLKAISGRYYSFSTFNEYLSLVIRLNKNIGYTEEVVVGEYVDRTYC